MISISISSFQKFIIKFIYFCRPYFTKAITLVVRDNSKVIYFYSLITKKSVNVDFLSSCDSFIFEI